MVYLADGETTTIPYPFFGSSVTKYYFSCDHLDSQQLQEKPCMLIVGMTALYWVLYVVTQGFH